MLLKHYKTQNARRFKRLRAEYLVKYELVENSNEEPVTTNIKDISAGGARFLTDQFIFEGTNLKVRICIPPIDKVLEARAKVVRVRRARPGELYYVGVEFVELSHEIREALNGFVEYLLGDSKTRAVVDHRDFVVRELESRRN